MSKIKMSNVFIYDYILMVLKAFWLTSGILGGLTKNLIYSKIL